MEKSNSSEGKNVVSSRIVLHNQCPRCGELTYMECIYPVDENGKTFSFHFCFSCGLVVKLMADRPDVYLNEKMKRRTCPVQQSFSWLVCFRSKDGLSEYYSFESWDKDGEEQVLSRFLNLMQDAEADRDKSYIARWDEGKGCVVKLNPHSCVVLN